MTDLDLEAIKARANGLEAAMDNDAANYDPGVWELGAEPVLRAPRPEPNYEF